MAEEGQQQEGQERTEQPTPKRLQDAKKKGQVARSRELNTSVMLLAGAAAILGLGDFLGNSVTAFVNDALTPPRAVLFDPMGPVTHFMKVVIAALTMLVPLLVILTIAAIASPLVLGGWVFSGQALAPKLNRIDPIKGLKKVFSARGLMELVKSILKVGLIGSTATLFIYQFTPDLMSIGALEPKQAISRAFTICGWALLAYSAVTLIIAAIDAPYQLWQHHKQLRMTKQEVKDERKQTEGDPEMKGRIRRMQQEAANQRMMEEVPQADVVITNPSHYAVALKYDQDKMSAPKLVAKGADLMAARIRQCAQLNDVPILSAPPLARAVYYSTKLNHEIPAELYLAVAQVLAYVFQLRRADQPGAYVPEPPTEFDIPEHLRR